MHQSESEYLLFHGGGEVSYVTPCSVQHQHVHSVVQKMVLKFENINIERKPNRVYRRARVSRRDLCSEPNHRKLLGGEK